MNANTEIKYTFYNEYDETVEMIFTIEQIEGVVGGFINNVIEELKDIEFGEIVKVDRELLS